MRPYPVRMLGRMLLAALVGLGGAIGSGMAIVAPLGLLRELQVIGFRIEDSVLFWVVLILGALWGVAHMADNIADWR
jgi:hypothetical protein